MRRKYADTETLRNMGTTQVLDAAGEWATFDVSKVDGWIIGVKMAKNGGTNVTYQLHGSWDGTTSTASKQSMQLGVSALDNMDVDYDDAGSNVVCDDEVQRYFFFTRDALFEYKPVAFAQGFHVYYGAQTGGPGQTLTCTIVQAWRNLTT